MPLIIITFFTTFAFLGMDKKQKREVDIFVVCCHISYRINFHVFSLFLVLKFILPFFEICLLLILPFSQLLPFWARTKTRTGSGHFRLCRHISNRIDFHVFTNSSSEIHLAIFLNLLFVNIGFFHSFCLFGHKNGE